MKQISEFKSIAIIGKYEIKVLVITALVFEDLSLTGFIQVNKSRTSWSTVGRKG